MTVRFSACRTAPLQLALALACCALPAHADDRIGGFVLGEGQESHLRGSPWNTNDFDEIPSREYDAATLLEGQFKTVTFRARFEETHVNEPNNQAHFIGKLAELNKVFALTDDVSLSLGKRLYSLDQSYVLQPLGFFQQRTDLSDPTDSLGQSVGLPMAILSWTGAKASLAGVYSKDFDTQPDGFNRGIEQSLIKAGYEFNGANIAVLVRRATGESTGFGATASGTIGDTVSWYSSWYRTHGTMRPILLSLINPQAPNAAGVQTLGSYRANDGIPYPRAAIGIIITPADLPRLQLEYSYDKRGLNASQFKQFIAIGDTGDGTVLAQINRAIASQMLTTQGIRQRYLSLSLTQSIGDLDINGGIYAGTEDWSSVQYCNAEYGLDQHWKLALSAMRQSGRDNTEREISPLASTITLRLRYLF